MGMGGSPPLARHNVVVLHSNNPQSDADELMLLFPNRFVLESKRSASTLVLVEESDGPPTAVGMMLILVLTGDTANDNPATSKTGGRHPVGTLVLKDHHEIRSAVARCESGNSTLRFTKSLALPSGTSHCAVICLVGGCNLLLVTPEFFVSTEGRSTFAQIVANPNKIPHVDTENGNELEEALTDVDLADETVNQRTLALESENGKSIMVEEDEFKETSLPKFPSLAIDVAQQAGQTNVDFPLNSRVGVPIETDLFLGKLLLIIRPPEPKDDPYYNEKIFSKKKRRLICQIQGKLKYAPKGMLYAGGEISDQMKLGLVGKGLCTMLLNLMRTFDSDMHYSFGDNKDVETPHIVFPAWQFFEHLIVTKPGGTPPPITEPFVESKSSRERRKASKGIGEWNADDTYSMAFYSMYLDLPHWRVVNLPVTKDLDLRTFWGNSFLSLVVYERGVSKEEKHVKKDNKYIFALNMKFLGHHALSGDGERSDSETEDILPWDKTRPLARSAPSGVDIPEYDGGEESDSDLTRFFDTKEVEDVDISAEDDDWFYFDSMQPPSSRELRAKLLPMVDFLCPAWVEVCSIKGKYTTAYAFNLKSGSETLFRTTSQFADLFDLEEAKRSVGALCSPRMSSSERGRRLMGHTFAHALTHSSAETAAKTHQFKTLRTDMDLEFLKKPVSPANTSRPVVISGHAARALSEHHWIEEWVQVTDRHISFYQPSKHRPSFRMSLRSIANVTSLKREESPSFPLYSFLAIETLGRTVYLMFAGEAERNHWETKLLELKSSTVKTQKTSMVKSVSSHESDGKRSVGSDFLLAVDDPTEEFMHKSSLWSCKHRRILNCRKFSFTGTSKSLDAAEAVEDALRRALDPIEDSEEGNLRAFLDSAAVLKRVDVNELSEKEKLAFFLNLYHVMIMHAFLVLGTPDSAFKWMSYFNMISYQCSDDIFSLTELEHNIIRASMNYPSQFISKFVLPKSHFRFALGHGDYRINFALNCGSYSNPASVPTYRAERLEDQLNQASVTYLRRSVQLSPRGNGTGVTVTLPRICQWFAQDFGDGSNLDVLRMIVKFLDENDQHCLLKPLCSEGREKKQFLALISDVSVKHLSYSFECRHLRLSDNLGPST